jgi:maltose alpha-D-glucosyltransferase/alpha-amylase
MKPTGSATDPQWYKDAVIYELHVRGYYDANQDGIGDFRGLIEKLDYLQDLGVTCLWLLPFFPSPLRDDGYDIADYTDVHPNYGTLDDFKDFLQAAHARGLQVLIELVINHTSDQHPWFQAARAAPPGSPERDFYVWSDTVEKYADARIIFTDTEKSNWTWDPEAKAYYWHRFFSHQPDLNFDNPAVVQEIIRVMKFWLDLGVDALRLDAIPYLVERDGTNCENLPETHVAIKQIRQAMDEGYANRMILAEANQWPEDVRAYFGAGDECHMAFHFPLMPRLFMALRLEDRHPVTDIMERTPPIPEPCQWGLFLRNHDELTLEMVSDDERDYMYLAYSADPRMRVNVGIRRRLAPLMENNRRRIELLDSILFSFPGTPILYFGDEIGMGDNIYLGDRNGVRTPMQWSGDRNAGFSRATPARLYSPVIMDPIYGYEAVNVEAQQGDPSSLLHWTKRMIALRKLFQVFGRGTIEFLNPTNQKILVYLRQYGSERVLCVANLSRFAQPVELDLSALAGVTPVEMLGYVEFPRIGTAPYPLTVGPYGFLWFELHGEPESEQVQAAPGRAEPELHADVAQGWEAVVAPAPRAFLERAVLPDFLSRQRWFGGKSRAIAGCHFEDWLPLGAASGLTLLRVHDGHDHNLYVLPLAVATGEAAAGIREHQPGAVICGLGNGAGVLYDAMASDEFCRALLGRLQGGEIRGAHGLLRGIPGKALERLAGLESGAGITRLAGEQSNTSIVFGDQIILKLYRRLTPGPQPDREVTRYLTEKLDFAGVPAFAGALEYQAGQGTAPPTVLSTLAIAQRFVPSQSDGWRWMQEELGRYFERALTMLLPDSRPVGGLRGWLEVADMGALEAPLADMLGVSDDAAAVLGRRTAELHLALATPTDDPAFAPEPVTSADLEALAADIRQNATAVIGVLRDSFPRLPDDLLEPVSQFLTLRSRLWARADRLRHLPPDGVKIRIHGDYHLGQVLRTGTDFTLIDFEGEPARPLAARRAKHSPLRDVAAMLRSFDYAAQTALLAHVARQPGDPDQLSVWARLWERSVGGVFLQAYLRATAGASLLPASRQVLERLLEGYLLDKALYELRYELDNRPSWVRVPLTGLLTMLLADGGST